MGTANEAKKLNQDFFFPKINWRSTYL